MNMNDPLRNIASNMSAISINEAINKAIDIDEIISEQTQEYNRKYSERENKEEEKPNTYEIVDGITEDMSKLDRETIPSYDDIDNGPYDNSSTTNEYGYATDVVQNTMKSSFSEEILTDENMRGKSNQLYENEEDRTDEK